MSTGDHFAYDLGDDSDPPTEELEDIIQPDQTADEGDSVVFLDLTLEHAPDPVPSPISLEDVSINTHIEVWWAGDRMWRRGTCIGHTPFGNIMTRYDDGVVLDDPLFDAQNRPVVRILESGKQDSAKPAHERKTECRVMNKVRCKYEVGHQCPRQPHQRTSLTSIHRHNSPACIKESSNSVFRTKPRLAHRQVRAQRPRGVKARRAKRKRSVKSNYYGVYRKNSGSRKAWYTRVHCQGKNHYIGTYDSEIETACQYDKFIKRMGFDRPLNFPEGAAE